MRTGQEPLRILVLAVALGGEVLAAAPGRSSRDLPANTWVKVNEKGAGVRRGSAVVWRTRQGRFLVLGGAGENRKLGIARPFEIQTFDPARREWREARPTGGKPDGARPTTDALLVPAGEGQRRLNDRFDPGSRSACDPGGEHVYLFQANDRRRPGELIVACYDVGRRRWQRVSSAKPPADADGVLPGEYGPTMVFLEGAAVVLDGVNEELLLIGGRTGNAADGFVGHWALSLKDKAWRRLGQPSPTLDALRARCLAAKAAARDASAAARNVLYAALAPADRRAAATGKPLRLARRALELAEAAAGAAGAAEADGWEARAVAHARPLLAEALGHLRAAAERLDAGRLDPAALKQLFDAGWRLDEAADLLRALPGERMHAGAVYDPARRCVVLFGGDHGDYLLGDTWIYDCRRRHWRRVFPTRCPAPRRAAGALVYLPGSRRVALVGGEGYIPKFIYFRRPPRRLRDVWVLDAPADRWSLAAEGDPNASAPVLVCQRAAGAGDVILGLSSAGRYAGQWDGTTWLLRVGPAAPAAPARKLAPSPGGRTYLTVVPPYDPCWYDQAAPGDAKATSAWLAKLRPNTWTPVPLAPRPAPRRDWGTAAFDPHRDQFYHWTGGHMADPSSLVSTYHVAVGRWSIPYVAEYFGKGIGFQGRPDCMNHTYLNYAYDPLSRRLVCTSLGGTCVYDPDRREFAPRIDQPFRQHPYYTKTVGTPRGVVCWERGYLGLLDVPARRWRPLRVRGKLPRVVHGDENAVTYDAKRDVLWLLAADGYQKPNGQVWRYDMKTGNVAAMDPVDTKTIGVKVRPRESVYLPRQDLVLHNSFAGDRQIAYDPAANRWVTLNIAPSHKGLGGVSIGLMYDPKRALVWAMSSGRRMYVLRVDSAALQVAPPAGE